MKLSAEIALDILGPAGMLAGESGVERRPLRRRLRVRAGVLDLRRHRRDPAQHRRGAHRSACPTGADAPSEPRTPMSAVFAFSDEQEEFRGMVRRFVEAHSPEAAVREQMETERGFDPAVWSAMAEQLGLQGLIVPEAFGGQGFGAVELGIVLEEMGRVAALRARTSRRWCSPSTPCCEAGDEAAQRALLPGIASGETIATLAFAEPNGRWDASGIEATARRDGAAWRIDGTKLVRPRRTHRRRRARRGPHARRRQPLPRGRRRRAGSRRTPLATLDPTRKQARLDLRRRRRRRSSAAEGAGDARAVRGARSGRGGARRRAGRRRAAMPRHVGRVRQAARAVRSPDRLVPGHQAQVRRRAARGRVGALRRLLRGLVCRRAQRRAARGGLAGQGLLLRRLLPRGEREHPDPRRHRLHLGAPRAPVLPAREVERVSSSATPRTTASGSPNAAECEGAQSRAGVRSRCRRRR